MVHDPSGSPKALLLLQKFWLTIDVFIILYVYMCIIYLAFVCLYEAQSSFDIKHLSPWSGNPGGALLCEMRHC